MSIKIPYLRKDTSNLLAFPAVIALLLLAGPLVISNFLLQPAQAQTTTMTFKTPNAATYTDPDLGLEYTLTFDAQGTATPSGPQAAKITNGTIQLHVPYTNPDGSGPPQTLTGNITSGVYDTSRSPPGIQFYATIQNVVYYVDSPCATSVPNPIGMSTEDSSGVIFSGGTFNGAVECSPSQSGGGDTAAQPTSSPSSATGTTTAQDSDGDGIPDSSDKCTHNSNHRCFKEDTSTQQQQQQQPSSNGSRNQTS
jgi:hypothetical protein